MAKQFLGYNFWFGQPSIILSSTDNLFGYVFLALVVLGIVFRVLVRFTKHDINRKVFLKLWHLCLTIGLSGLVWFGFRYENVQILGQRLWAGLLILSGLVWLLFILKYLVFNYPRERREYNREQIKSKYLSGKRA